jgi:hypothetical protein
MAKTYVNTCETVDKKAAGYLAVSDILLTHSCQTYTFKKITRARYKNFFSNNIHISNSNSGNSAKFFIADIPKSCIYQFKLLKHAKLSISGNL